MSPHTDILISIIDIRLVVSVAGVEWPVAYKIASINELTLKNGIVPRADEPNDPEPKLVDELITSLLY
jgi:hypothetical protein